MQVLHLGGNQMRYKAATALATVLLAAATAGVSARQGIVTFNANLRSGPGIENPVVAIIPDQAPIDVGACTGSWCHVNWNGLDGYLSTSLIASASSRGTQPAQEPLAGPPVVGDIVRPLTTLLPGCDPSFDPNCAGYNGNYAYDSGYGPNYAYGDYGDYGYGNYGYYGAGGVYLGGYEGRRYGGARFGGGAAYMRNGRPARAGAPLVNANAPGSRGGQAHIGAGRFGAGAGRVGERR
jgi:uncharacterized protein YraI